MWSPDMPSFLWTAKLLQIHKSCQFVSDQWVFAAKAAHSSRSAFNGKINDKDLLKPYFSVTLFMYMSAVDLLIMINK